MTVSKFCEKCGKMMWDVQPCKRFCDTCIKEKARQRAKLNYEKKKAQQQGIISTMQAKKPDKKAALKPHIKSIEQCVREPPRWTSPTASMCSAGMTKSHGMKF